MSIKTKLYGAHEYYVLNAYANDVHIRSDATDECAQGHLVEETHRKTQHVSVQLATHVEYDIFTQAKG